jgi:CRP-like cAMP-binding protein
VAERETVAAHHVAVHPFVRSLEAADVTVLQEIATAVEFPSGGVIFEAGGEADTFYLVRTGVVALQLPDPAGVPRTIQTLKEGSALGWSWLHEPRRWQFTAVARTPVRALALETSRLRAWFAEDPGAGYRVLLRVTELMAERLHATRRQVMQLSGG